MNKNASYQWGVFCAFASAFLWSTTFIGGRWLLKDRSIDPVSLSVIRFGIGGMLLFFYGCLFCRHQLFNIKLKDILALTWLSLFGIVGMSVFLFVGQIHTSAINTSMIMALSPILTMLLGTFAGKRINAFMACGMLISLTGCLLVLGVITQSGFAYKSGNIPGDSMVFCSAACWSVYAVFSGKTVERLGGYTATTWGILIGFAELLIVWALWPWQLTIPGAAQPEHWAAVLYIAVFPTAIAFFAWYEAMARIKLSLLNIMQYLTPLFTVLLAFLLFGETMSPLNIIGAFMVLAGVMLAFGISGWNLLSLLNRSAPPVVKPQ
ncbi:MAG: DMT family transporter [Victivallaceae bacterium]|jgi:drug/metabolite transporter (DMT)-like permease